jgi:hypothetical protein
MSTNESKTDSPAHKMLLGAAAIAQFLYGKSEDKEVRDVYRNVAGLTFFHHGNSLAAFPDTLMAELRQKERQARKKLDANIARLNGTDNGKPKTDSAA